MADYIKRKIVEKLAMFTKDLRPSDISLSVLRGKGQLNNLAINEAMIQEVLRLPPWISIDRVHCDNISIDVPFTDLNKSPIRCILNEVSVVVSTCSEEDKLRKTVELNLMKLSSSGSSYGMIDRIIDGMRLEIRTILVTFNNPVFNAKLEMSEVVIASTTPQWEEAPLVNCRYKNDDEGSVVIYKKCTWGSLKLEGHGEGVAEALRLITNHTEIRVVLKRRLNDCKVLHTRVSVSLGDLVWVLTSAHLRAISKLAQSLVEAAVLWKKKERIEFNKWRGSQDSIDSIDSVASSGSGGRGNGAAPPKEEDKPRNKIKRGRSPNRKDEKELIRERKMQSLVAAYQMGSKNLPAHEVIQDSIHIKTGTVNLQLCDDKGSLMLELKKVVVDVYLDQDAGSGRCHWNKANMRLSENTEWSANLVRGAEKVQHLDLPSINMYKLKERGIVIRCGDFAIKSPAQEDLLPILSCDKQTFSLPDDVDNPAFQCGITMYYYPPEQGNRFLVPRPNVFLYLSPLHVNFHQDQCLWLAEFVHSIARTVNLNLLLSAHTEGQALIEQFKAKQDDIQQLPGVDIKFYIPYSKITLPLAKNYGDGRPRALQIETGGINVQNQSLMSTLGNQDFLAMWDNIKKGWLTTPTSQFPHDPSSDPSPIPNLLKDLIDREIKSQASPSAPFSGLLGTRSSSMLQVPSSAHTGRGQSSGRRSTPDITVSKGRLSVDQLQLLALECWYVHTRCVTLSFVKNLTHAATLYTDEFVHDFPLKMWLFQTTKMAELLDPSKSTLSIPHLHVMASLPESVSIQLEHLQFLFLMRLKDSFEGFKNRMMQFLTIESLIDSQGHDAFQLKREDGENDSEGDGEEERGLKERLVSAFKQDDGLDDERPRSDSEINKAMITATACVEGISVFIKLPSLMDSKATPTTTPSSVHSKEPSPCINVSSVSTPTSSEHRVYPSTNGGSTHLTPSVHSSSNFSSTGSEDFVIVKTPMEIERRPSKSPDLGPHPSESPDMRPHPSKESLDSGPHLADMKSLELSDLRSRPSESPDLSHDKEHSPPAVSMATTELDDIPMVTELTQDVNMEVPIPIVDLADTISTTTSSSSVGVASPRRLKSPTSILSYTPEHTLYVATGTVRALLHFKEEAIVARATVDSLNLAELTDKEVEEKSSSRHSHRQKQACRNETQSETQTSQLPIIKARVELGNCVHKYFTDPAIGKMPDSVIMVKLSGLKTALFIKNVLVLKDFFDDEVEAPFPAPLQLRIMETQVAIKDAFLAPPTHPRNVTVTIPDLFINRGPPAQGTNLVLATESEDVAETTSSSSMTTSTPEETNQILLESFQHFIDAFQRHVANSESGDVSVPQPDKISHLLKELELAISTPPTYNEAITCAFYSNVNSVSPHVTMDTLQTELENLKMENKQLMNDLSIVNEEKMSACEERDNVVSELIDVKMKLASAHLVLEQNLQKIETLFNENSNLKELVQGTNLTGGNSTFQK